MLNTIQEKVLTYDFGIFRDNPAFTDRRGVGKIGTTGFLLGLFGGLHFGFLVFIFCLLGWGGGSDEPFPLFSPKWQCTVIWSFYMTALCLFHFSEFFCTAVKQPSNVSYESYIINHSKQYTVAHVFSWIEFWLEYMILGPRKFHLSLVLVGAAFVVIGQVIRAVGMFQCGEHFNHIIMQQKPDTHKLVTTGIYSYLRHPSYTGWFYWCIGTQLVLSNPLSTLAFTYAAWSFFNTRIPYEEHLLMQFYPQYQSYAARTIIGIPLVASPLV